jgi:large subunit ribosomal protein L10
MKKTEKATIISSLAKEFTSSTSTTFVDFAKLGVAPQQELKKALKTAGARMFVAKNTLIRLAGQEAKLPEASLTDQVLSGQTAIILTTGDPVAPIQALGKYLKTNEVPQPKGAIVEGIFQDKAGVMAISALPSKQELYGQAVGSIMSPLYGLVGTLQGNLQKLVWILNAHASA